MGTVHFGSEKRIRLPITISVKRGLSFVICETSTFNSPDSSKDPYPLSSSPPHLSIETEPEKNRIETIVSHLGLSNPRSSLKLSLRSSISFSSSLIFRWIGTRFGIWFRTCASIVVGSTKVRMYRSTLGAI